MLALRLWEYGAWTRRVLTKKPLFTEVREGNLLRWWSTATAEVGAEIVYLGHGYCRISEGGRSTIVQAHYLNVDTYMNLKLVGNKPFVHRLLSGHGYRVPRFTEFSLAKLEKSLGVCADRRWALRGQAQQRFRRFWCDHRHRQPAAVASGSRCLVGGELSATAYDRGGQRCHQRDQYSTRPALSRADRQSGEEGERVYADSGAYFLRVTVGPYRGRHGVLGKIFLAQSRIRLAQSDPRRLR